MKPIYSLILTAAAYLNGIAQVTTHIDSGGLLFVEKSALYYNNGGAQMKSGIIKNRGRVMVNSNAPGDVFRTVKSDNSDVSQIETQSNIGGYFVNLLNEPEGYYLPNTVVEGDRYTYGQLWISGLDQGNVTGYVHEEYRNVNHGGYQQIGLPFYGKMLTSLNAELGKTFNNIRWSQNEILAWNNTRVVFDNLDFSQPRTDGTDYYVLGNKANSIDVSSITKTLTGRPHTDGTQMVKTLSNAGSGIDFGANGNAINQYNERYNSYLQDGFELQKALDGNPWQGNYGRNLYELANPFLTNIDLRNIFIDEPDGDGNYLSNIYGIRLEQQAGTVVYTPGQGGGSTSFRFVTWDSDTQSPVGDVDWLIVRPLGVFVIKLKDKTPQTLDFNKLRRFGYIPRKPETPYSPTAGKSGATVKQLGIIALDDNNKEIGRTYYVVSPGAKTGHDGNTLYQVSASSTNVVGSYEEKPSGGYDNNFTGKYWLYINEANEGDFQGKPIPAVIYDSRVKSLQFEIRENSELVPEGAAELSTGIPFYYGLGNEIIKISQNQKVPVIPGVGTEFQLYYGSPVTLNNGNAVVVQEKTIITYNPMIGKHIVHFASDWKSANIEVFDIAGRLVSKQDNWATSKGDYVINLWNVDASYIVKVVSADGKIVTNKIIDNIHRGNRFIK